MIERKKVRRGPVSINPRSGSVESPAAHDIDDYPEAKPVPGLVVYRYDAPLCFANAEDFRERALAAVEESPTPVEWFVLNSEANVEVDLTAFGFGIQTAEYVLNNLILNAAAHCGEIACLKGLQGAKGYGF